MYTDQISKIYESMNQKTIDVDGEQKHRFNSNNQLIHHTDEGIRNFHRWFGDSNMVDEHGRPKVFYHSTLADKHEFENTGKFMGHSGVSGISVTDNPSMANRYLDRYCTHGWVNGKPNQPFDKNVIPVYLNIKNPLHQNDPVKTNIKIGHPLPNNYENPLIKMGHDALIRDDSISKGGSVKHSHAKNALRGKEIIVFHPHQIKSAIGNNGDFSSSKKLVESLDKQEFNATIRN